MTQPAQLGKLGIPVSPDYMSFMAPMLMQGVEDFNEIEETPHNCHACGATVMARQAVTQFFPGGTVCCDDCTETFIYQEKVKAMKDYWDALCPRDFREMKKDHPAFNRQAWERIRTFPIDTSFVFLGESGMCKTFIALERIKHCILAEKTAKIIFPHDIEDLAQWERRQLVVDICRPQVMLLDDILNVGCGSEQMAKFVFNIINKRCMDRKTTIITTQLNSSDFHSSVNIFNNMSAGESKRIEAIVRRIREKFTPIDFDALSKPETLSEAKF